MANVTLEEADLHQLSARISSQVVEQLKTHFGSSELPKSQPMQGTDVPVRNGADQADGRKGSQTPALS